MIHRSPRFLVSLALGVLLSAGPALAGEVVIVHGGAGGPELESALRDALSAFGVEVAGDDVVDVGVIKPPYPDEMVAYGTASQGRCSSRERSWDEMRGEIARGKEALDSLEYAEAEQILGRVWESLACADAFVDPGTLIELTMALGLAAHFRDQFNPARQWFSYALAVHPDLAWNDAYPPDAQQVFNHALAELLRAGEATMEVVPGEGVTEVMVDGRTVDPLSPRLSLKQGTHLVQWRGSDGAVAGVTVFVLGGDQAVLLSADGLREAILGGPASPATLPAVLERLEVLASSRGASQVVVLGEPMPYRWTVGADQVEEAPLESAAAVSDSAPGPTRRAGGAGPALIAAGGGTTAAGAILAVASYASGQAIREEIDGGGLSPEEEAERTAAYDQRMDLNAVGFVVAGVGAAVLITGIVITATSGGGEQASADASPIHVGLAPLPGGAWGQLTVRF